MLCVLRGSSHSSSVRIERYANSRQYGRRFGLGLGSLNLAEGVGVAESNHEHNQAYWRSNFRLILGLLVVWASVSFGAGILFVEQLNAFQFFGVPFGFWMAHQGSIYVFVVIIFFYAIRMDALDHRHKLDTDDEAGDA